MRLVRKQLIVCGQVCGQRELGVPSPAPSARSALPSDRQTPEDNEAATPLSLLRPQALGAPQVPGGEWGNGQEAGGILEPVPGYLLAQMDPI